MAPEAARGRPDVQGRGIGKKWLGAFLEIVDEQHMPASLETDVDRNVALYEQLGFLVMASQDIAGVNSRFMWHEARARRLMMIFTTGALTNLDLVRVCPKPPLPLWPTSPGWS